MFSRIRNSSRRTSSTPTTLSTTSSARSSTRSSTMSGSQLISDTTTTSTYQSQEDLMPEDEPVGIIDELYDFFSHEEVEDDVQVFEMSEKQFRKRQALVQKLFDSESDYVNRLHVCRNTFQRPILKHFSLTANQRVASNVTLTRQDIEMFFMPMERLYRAHELFLEKLSQRFQIWGPTQLLSDVLLQLLESVPVYDLYLENFPRMMAILEVLSRHKEARKLLEANVTNPGGIGDIHLFSLLELPLYALPQYYHLILELYKLTDPSHPDSAQLKQLQKRFAPVDQDAKPRIKICRNISQMMDMSLTVRGCPFMMDQPRQFIRSGKLLCAESKGGMEVRICFLLNDQLVLARPVDGALTYKTKVRLKNASIKTVKRMDASFILVEDAPDPTRQFSDEISSLLDAAGSTPSKQFTFKGESLDEILTWLRDLQSVMQNVQITRRRPTTASSRS
ncbi:Dbl homology domain-containing protein [Gongronella butleri]|nr:Dbl homology domain-containing protein [Gongronella butleri]